MSAPRVEARGAGAVVAVRVQPRARREGLVGLHDGALKVALRAPPVDGAANAALTRFFAKLMDVPARSVLIVQGATGRSKRVAFETLDPETLRARLERALEPS